MTNEDLKLKARTMIEVTEREYCSKIIHGVKEIRTFGDLYGRLSKSEPLLIVTEWGVDAKVLFRTEMRKKDGHQEKWDCTYFLDESLVPQNSTPEK